MDEILGRVLRTAVWERLDMLTELAERADTSSLLSVARSELPRLTECWRELLNAHQPDNRGNCRECSTRWRQQQAPCEVWRAAYEHLVMGGLAPSAADPNTGAAPAATATIGKNRLTNASSADRTHLIVGAA
ncbi:hypothetical protein [Actinoalloteichus hymeniacidonis]|uniref:Uncharacterized protein n=1 Tax=Actinoalloteichus hymeniacidonis TaxID=340345 RepID=A0AAC9HL41_9PSEU|nr:hypothetical protein [Actinoalloteichus hymeniacidonis]AOS60890.1 hypothetical protein TL08_00205 [Actinoalloteichus hymeniacidonis]MBB5911110.1 hypothetical protein [Actinoalloteichus hymeniacidonis]